MTKENKKIYTCNLKSSKISENYLVKNVSNYGVKNSSAISLIALIITIIVLLILVGVILNMVMGESGIINKAQLAKEKTEVAQQDEEQDIKELENMIDSIIATSNRNDNSLSLKESKLEGIAWNGVQSQTVLINYKCEKDCNYVCLGYVNNDCYLNSCEINVEGQNLINIDGTNNIKMSVGRATKGQTIKIEVSASTSLSFHNLYAFILTDE